jgi:hypothetical protein
MRFSAERTRLACRFRRLAENLLIDRGALGEAPNAAREGACAPQILQLALVDRSS